RLHGLREALNGQDNCRTVPLRTWRVPTLRGPVPNVGYWCGPRVPGPDVRCPAPVVAIFSRRAGAQPPVVRDDQGHLCGYGARRLGGGDGLRHSGRRAVPPTHRGWHSPRVLNRRFRKLQAHIGTESNDGSRFQFGFTRFYLAERTVCPYLLRPNFLILDSSV